MKSNKDRYIIHCRIDGKRHTICSEVENRIMWFDEVNDAKKIVEERLLTNDKVKFDEITIERNREVVEKY